MTKPGGAPTRRSAIGADATGLSICFVNDRHLADAGATTTGVMVQEFLLGRELATRGWLVTHLVGTADPGLAGTTVDHEGTTVHFLADRRYGPLRHISRWRQALAAVDTGVFYQRGRSILTFLASEAARRSGGLFVWASAGETGVLRGRNRREVLPRKQGIARRAALLPWAILQDVLYERGMERADLLLVQTETQGNLLELEFGRRGVVMPSGHPVPEGDVLVKRPPPLVLWVGSIKDSKQPAIFLDLARRLGDLETRFAMVGSLSDQRYRGEIAGAERELRAFSYRGQVPFDSMGPLFAEAAVLVNTTRQGYEGLPNTFIQAWLHGLPVASLWCDPDGSLEREGAGIVARGDTGLLADGVRRLIGDGALRERMGLAGRVFAEHAYGLPAVADRLEGVLRERLESRGDREGR